MNAPTSPTLVPHLLSIAQQRLLDHLSAVVGEDVTDAFVAALDELSILRGLGGQSGSHRATLYAAGQIIAAVATLRCELGFDVISGILTMALEDEARLRDLTKKFRRPDAVS